MRISDWSSDVCSSDLAAAGLVAGSAGRLARALAARGMGNAVAGHGGGSGFSRRDQCARGAQSTGVRQRLSGELRSEEHTSELQSLMRISYVVFCIKKKKKQHTPIISDINKSTRIKT